jgi:hypothetical protein
MLPAEGASSAFEGADDIVIRLRDDRHGDISA